MIPQPVRQVPEGQYTEKIYGLIRQQKYDDVIKILSAELLNFPNSRAALSLLAYCAYHKQDFDLAAQYYAQLSGLFPEVDQYRMYHAQSLLKAGLHDNASQALMALESPQLGHQVLYLQAVIKYEQEELGLAKSLVDHTAAQSEGESDPELTVLAAAILWKEKKYEEARKMFSDAMNTLGYQPELAYNLALCHYSMKQYDHARKFLADIIERGIRHHPELEVGRNRDDVEVRSVGNTAVLKETCVIEALNLTAAIEFLAGSGDKAREALLDMPPRAEDELDPVSLHNQALMNMDSNPTGGFKKLNFLLQNPPFPPETFVNLLLLYCKHSYFDLAADIQAENAHLTFKCLEQDDFDFLDTLILAQTAPEDAYRRFDELAAKHVENLRKITKLLQDARRNRDSSAVKQQLADFETALNKYIPVLMGQAKIYWDLENYTAVEKLFRQSAEFCNDSETWKLNVAHVFFMQGDKYKECIRYYEQFVKKHADNLLNVTAIVLANLCVAYIMTSQNEEAEELMRQIEKEEERVQLQDPSRQVYHLCIINLVIGTLYCAKGNYEFGISRIIKSLEPYNKKLGVDTWYYAKRCFLALLETLAKHMIMLRDQSFHDILTFLDAADQHGADILTTIKPSDAAEGGLRRVPTVSYEARRLKQLVLKLRD
ncbi:unnamed protein product [Vitrella brassicaformis CCMP3155]|uniref:Tetratricopeptide repeat protein 30 n=3 Tax=Vitrella brassicaformis TaxID=1169539 RepID=A0A0G4EFC5_VITBC|nr:unnamed protein product [Vitrella brassicaformis CCMP3155]|eukprot:CEL94681.1 unnamed protein product [Vitrella brassicaformis CCMP3155]